MIADSSVFAVLPEARGNWAVASIFGEAERLAELHTQLAHRVQPEDNLICLGNFLGRGAVAATVQELLVFRRTLMARQLTATHGEIVYLRGSQEEMWHKLLQMQFAPNPREVLEWMLLQGVGPTLEAYGGTIEDARTAAKLGAVAMSRWTNRLRVVMREADGHERLMNVLRRAAYTRNARCCSSTPASIPAARCRSRVIHFGGETASSRRFRSPSTALTVSFAVPPRASAAW